MSNIKSGKGARMLSAASFVAALLFGYWTHEPSASAFTCSGFECVCGYEDINPASGLPQLPESQWDDDCQDLADYCARIAMDYGCTNDCMLPSTGCSCTCNTPPPQP